MPDTEVKSTETMENEELEHCTLCDKSVRKSYFRDHLRVHKLKRSHKCDECGKGFKRPSQLKTHKECVHFDIRLFNCDICGKAFHDKNKLSTHMLVHTGEKPYGCRYCDKFFGGRAQRKYHERRHTHFSEKPYKCSICNKAFTSSSYARKHEKAHITGREKSHQCDICLKNFTHKYQLKVHTQSVHMRIRNFECNICGHESYDQKALRRHMFVHRAVEKPFKCKYCSKCYSTAINVERHTKKIHLGEKHFQCIHCDQSFINYHQLVMHKRRKHSGQLLYQCRYCPKKAHNRAHLTTHEKKHITEKKFYQCKFCDKGFPLHQTLLRHERVHTGERPYKCHTCDMAFTSHSGRKRHEKVHSGEKPFQCDICPRTFRENDVLKRHKVVVHLKSFSFKCENCGQDFLVKKKDMPLNDEERPRECETCREAFNEPGGRRSYLHKFPIKISRAALTNARISEEKTRRRAVTSQLLSSNIDNTSYECGICSETFSKLTYLRTHMDDVHLSDRIFSCHLCSRTFKREKGLSIHSWKCQVKAQVALIEDGMSKEEALLAVQPPIEESIIKIIDDLDVPAYSQVNNTDLRQCAARKFICHLCPLTFNEEGEQRIHTRECQAEARAALVEDGMDEEEAHQAVQPPMVKNNIKSIDGRQDETISNHFKLKKCFIRIQRLSYIELAIEMGCSTLLIPRNINHNDRIYEPQLVIYNN